MGGPNTGKTTSLLTCERPLHVISYPGELGVASLPQGEGIHTYIWETSPEEKIDSQYVVNQVEKLTWDIIGGKYGGVRTLAGDGIHKLAYYYLDAASGGTFFRGEDFELERKFGKVDPYSKCYNNFMRYLERVWQSPVPYFIATCWDGTEPDSYKGVEVKGGRIYPGVPGQLAKKMLGMFSVVLYTHVEESSVPTKPAEYYWQTKADQKVAGASIKITPDLHAKLPHRIRQDFVALQALLSKIRGQ